MSEASRAERVASVHKMRFGLESIVASVPSYSVHSHLLMKGGCFYGQHGAVHRGGVKISESVVELHLVLVIREILR